LVFIESSAVTAFVHEKDAFPAKVNELYAVFLSQAESNEQLSKQALQKKRI